MKRPLALVALSVLLTGCQQTISSLPSEVTKIPLAYAETGGLYEISGADLYQKAITDQENVAFLVTYVGCSNCATAKADIDPFAVTMHMAVYYIELNGADPDYQATYQYIYEVTNIASDYSDPDGWPVIGEDYQTPCLYVMWNTWIGLCTYDSFTTKLATYTEVIS